jgi:hypothetical protein
VKMVETYAAGAAHLRQIDRPRASWIGSSPSSRRWRRSTSTADLASCSATESADAGRSAGCDFGEGSGDSRAAHSLKGTGYSGSREGV